MAETEFTVVYDGAAVSGGDIPVRDLAPSLFALGDLFDQASALVLPVGVEVSLDIRATEPHSFDVVLVLKSIGDWTQHVLTSDETNSLLNFKDLVLATGGFLAYIQWLRRRTVEKEEVVSADEKRVTTTDGDSKVVRRQVTTLSNSVTMLRRSQDFLAPLAKDGIDEVRILNAPEDASPAVVLESDDVAEFEPGSSSEEDEVISDATYETRLLIDGPILTNPDAKWQFHEGPMRVTASIEDEDFIAQIANHTLRFGAGDELKVDLHRVLKRLHKSGQTRTYYTIKKVTGFIPAEPLPTPLPGFGGGAEPVDTQDPTTQDDGDSTAEEQAS